MSWLAICRSLVLVPMCLVMLINCRGITVLY